MIKRMRRKFIFIAMSSVVLVLSAIIGVINVLNYARVGEYADLVLSILAENGGAFPADFTTDADEWNGISPETPFEARYFTVFLDENGGIAETDINYIAAITEEEAGALAETLFAAGKTEGMSDDYKYVAVTTDGGVLYIFLDCSKDLYFFRNFLLYSILISLGGLVLVFFLVLFLSELALKPVEESYLKQKNFITNASHDIRTPLAVIGAETDVIELENGESDCTREIKKQIGRLDSLTEKLVQLSKMEEKKQNLSLLPFNLSDLLAETLPPYRALAQSKGLALVSRIQENVIIGGDEDMIRQAIALLLDNALKYTAARGAISVSMKKTGKNCLLTFYNDAEGIAKGKRNEIFNRFYRMEAARGSETGGHGIGLSAVKAIVEAHRGKISAYSADGASLTIEISL